MNIIWAIGGWDYLLGEVREGGRICGTVDHLSDVPAAVRHIRGMAARLGWEKGEVVVTDDHNERIDVPGAAPAFGRRIG